MEKLELRIFGDGRIKVILEGKEVEYESELEEIIRKIENKEIAQEVFFNDKPAKLCLTQGGFGTEEHGFFAPVLFNPFANFLITVMNNQN